jgi:hypothetical protein
MCGKSLRWMLVLLAGALFGVNVRSFRVMVRDVSIGAYRCRYYRNPHDPDDGWAAIWKYGKLISNEGYDVSNDFVPPPGSDVTGDHVPDRVVLDYVIVGLSQCWYQYFIYPDYDARKKFVFDAMRTELTFADLDGDGVFEATGEDWSLEYWLPGYSLSPHPRYIVRFREDEYQLALYLMRKPAPSNRDLLLLVEEVRGAVDQAPKTTFIYDSEAGPIMWKIMFDLVYEGNGRSARRFYDLLWMHRDSLRKDAIFSNPANRSRLLRDFRQELTMSRFFFEILDLNHWQSEEEF